MRRHYTLACCYDDGVTLGGLSSAVFACVKQALLLQAWLGAAQKPTLKNVRRASRLQSWFELTSESATTTSKRKKCKAFARKNGAFITVPFATEWLEFGRFNKLGSRWGLQRYSYQNQQRCARRSMSANHRRSKGKADFFRAYFRLNFDPDIMCISEGKS